MSAHFTVTKPRYEFEYDNGRIDARFFDTKAVPFSRQLDDEHLKRIGEKNPYYVHDLQWSIEEEREVVRIFDTRVLLWVGFMFFFMQLDRANLSNALTDNLMSDLSINLETVTLGSTVFIICFVVFELPSQILFRTVGASIWTPTLLILWGTATFSQGFMNNRTSYLLTRGLVGTFEAGFIPAITFYLTTFYKRDEIGLRLAIFWSSLAISSSCGGLLAFGLLHLRGVMGLSGWRWLFLIEGIITILVGFLSLFLLPQGPTSTKGTRLWFSNYLNLRQEQIAMTRLIRDDPSKAERSNRIVPLKDIYDAFTNFRIGPNLLIGFFGLAPSYPLNIFGPLIIKQLGFTGLSANLMIIPGQILSLIFMNLISWSSDKRHERAIHGLVGSTYYAFWVLLLAVLPLTTNKYLVYFVYVMALGGYSCWHPLNAAWISENTAPVGRRTISLALYVMAVNISCIPGTSVFHDQDAPRYIPGMRVLFGSLVITMVLFLVQRYHLKWVNKKRLEETKHWTNVDWTNYDLVCQSESVVGDSRLDFLYVY